jgi:diguanylate cyclase (GGDEF)-like protein/PAS domain S-box-containing protein
VSRIGPIQAALAEVEADGGQESEAGFRALAEDAPCAIFIVQGAEIRFANRAAREITGYSTDDFEHCALWDVVHPDDRERVRRLVADMYSSSAPSRYEVKLVRKNGQPRWVDFSASALNYRGRPAIMGVGLDITERKLADARIEALAYRDALTGLPNRRLLQDRVGVAMAQAHRRCQRLGILFLDLDHFKDVNDSLGHPAGDELLKTVAKRLDRAMRRDDTVARIGGDEFVVLLTHLADANQAALVAQKILVLLKAPVRVGGRELFVKGSIGISVYPEDGTDFDSLLKNADVALYRAKHEGRDNGQLYTLSLHEAAMARLETEGGLRRALERGELFLEYQPTYDRTANRIHGVEAPSGPAGMQGAIEVIGAPGLLQMCYLGRLSGALEATHRARTIRMTFETGRLATATSEELQGRDAVMQFLAWTEGRFAFHPGATAEGGPISEPMDFLILEACRILDEKSATKTDN